jgi:hypothetical protein
MSHAHLFFASLFALTASQVAACQVDATQTSDTEQPDQTEQTEVPDIGQITNECAEGAEECVEACLDVQMLDPTTLEDCLGDVEQCLEDNADDPTLCAEAAEECIGADVNEVGDCLTQCQVDFGDCAPDALPEPPELPDTDIGEVVECATDHVECFSDCANDFASCELPAVECEGLDTLIDCVTVGDPQAMQDCIEGLAGSFGDCTVVPVDLSCLEDSPACFQECGEAIQDCIGN